MTQRLVYSRHDIQSETVLQNECDGCYWYEG